MCKTIAVIFALLSIFSTAALAQKSRMLSPDEVLQKTLAKLLSLKTISYKYHQEYNYASEGFKAESAADTYLEFTPIDNVIGVKFQFKNDTSFSAYNGSEVFQLNEKDKTIKVEPNPKAERLGGWSYLQFTPLMLRNGLPAVIADKSIVRSIAATTDKTYIVEFTLDKRFIESGDGSIKPMTIDRKTVYHLTIDKASFMPIEVVRGNNVNKDFNRTTYTAIVENPKPPVETSWFYSTYLNEYKYATPPVDNLIKTGESAYDISLPLYATAKTAALSDYKGKVVLLDFWIYHCGPCQESVPKLNALQEKYKNKEFKLLTINVADSPKLIQLFVKNKKPKFPILYKGDEIGRKYGVVGYPTIVLIDKSGRVIYSGQYDESKITKMIDRFL